MRDKAEETMSRERSHAAFVVLSCAAVLLTLLGVVGISRSVLASSVGPAAARGSAALGDAPARLGQVRAHAPAQRLPDLRRRRNLHSHRNALHNKGDEGFFAHLTRRGFVVVPCASKVSETRFLIV